MDVHTTVLLHIIANNFFQNIFFKNLIHLWTSPFNVPFVFFISAMKTVSI